MDRFLEEGVPLSVAVIDIAWQVYRIDHLKDIIADWLNRHLMDNVPEGTGGAWSGFTWENKYYPDPVAFLKALHDRGLMTALNNHPDQGIRYFETKYDECCKYLGLDPEKKLVGRGSS